MRIVDVKERIARLRQHPNARKVFGAAHHGFRLAAPLSTDQLTAFEERRGVVLPASYQEWLLEVASSGAGPGNGLFVPGMWNLGDKVDREWTGKQFGPLGSPFPYSVASERHRGPLPGGMPLCDFGCGIVGVLVTAGAERGRIWIDHRKESADGGLVPEDGLDFGDWMEAWLAESERRVDDVEVREPKVKRASTVLAATSIVSEAALVELRERTLARLREKPTANIGKLGQFRFQGNRIEFSRGRAVSAALKGEPLPAVARSAAPEVGTLTKLFAALLAAPVWTEIEVPGLLVARVWQEERTAYRDYLGRTRWLGYEDRWLSVNTSAAKL